MWNWKEPTEAEIKSFLSQQEQQQLSYSEVGATIKNEKPLGYNHDDYSLYLGEGEKIFQQACEVVRTWKMYPPGWTRVYPATLVEKGKTVVVLAKAYGFWWINACRIVEVFEEEKPIHRCGFAYGTLPGHVEQGEECFSVEWHQDDRVYYRVNVFSRPVFWIVRLASLFARRAQKRFVYETQKRMQSLITT